MANICHQMVSSRSTQSIRSYVNSYVHNTSTCLCERLVKKTIYLCPTTARPLHESDKKQTNVANVVCCLKYMAFVLCDHL